jgi:microcompartment protein CcmK/EutM
MMKEEKFGEEEWAGTNEVVGVVGGSSARGQGWADEEVKEWDKAGHPVLQLG